MHAASASAYRAHCCCCCGENTARKSSATRVPGWRLGFTLSVNKFICSRDTGFEVCVKKPPCLDVRCNSRVGSRDTFLQATGPSYSGVCQATHVPSSRTLRKLHGRAQVNHTLLILLLRCSGTLKVIAAKVVARNHGTFDASKFDNHGC